MKVLTSSLCALALCVFATASWAQCSYDSDVKITMQSDKHQTTSQSAMPEVDDKTLIVNTQKPESTTN